MGEESIDIGSLEYINPSEDLTEEQKSALDGTRAKVSKAYTKLKKTTFGEDGKPLPAGQSREVMVIVVETIAVAKNSAGIEQTVKEEFPLKKNKVSGKWTVSTHEKSKATKFFKKYNINKFEEAVGRDVILSKKVRTSGTTYMGISLG